MAELQFRYLDDVYCSILGNSANMGCLAQNPYDCSHYDDGTRRQKTENGCCGIIGDGSCRHACEIWAIKGLRTSQFEINDTEDPYNPRLPKYTLKVRNKEYECDWIKVDGVSADVLLFESAERITGNK